MDLIPVLAVRWGLREQSFPEPLNSTSHSPLKMHLVINVLWGSEK